MTKKPAADQPAASTDASEAAAANGASEGATAPEATAPADEPQADEPAADQPAAADPGHVDGQQGDGQDTAIAATVAEALPEAPSLANPESLGDAVIHHPAGATSCTFDGVTYEADEAGKITVPLRAVAALGAHGFVLAD